MDTTVMILFTLTRDILAAMALLSLSIVYMKFCSVCKEISA